MPPRPLPVPTNIFVFFKGIQRARKSPIENPTAKNVYKNKRFFLFFVKEQQKTLKIEAAKRGLILPTFAVLQKLCTLQVGSWKGSRRGPKEYIFA